MALVLAIGAWAQSPELPHPYAVEIIAAQGPFGAPPYDDPASLLGMPSTNFFDPWGEMSGGTLVRRVKLVEAPHNLDPLQTRKLLTTLGEGSVVVARFAQPITDDPAHPYGVDLLVFGNTFFVPSRLVNDSTDMNTLLLAGEEFAEPMKVSVSPGYTGEPGQDPADWQTWPWYRYDHGPYADTGFPTQAYRWNRADATWSDELMDFTKPVNPALGALLSSSDSGALSAADAMDLYDGSGGGTGFDLAASGFSSVRYVKVEGLAGFDGGELDAFAGVRPMVLGDSLTIAPANLTNGWTTLRFQQPDHSADSALTVSFLAVSEVARVLTAPLSETPIPAPSPGRLLSAAWLDLAPVLGTNRVAFQADVRVPAGPDYAGNGSDLDLLEREGTNWTRTSFTFEAATRSALLAGATNLSPLALVQVAPPRLTLVASDRGIAIQFTPVPDWHHTLERATNFATWSDVASVHPTRPEPATLSDPDPPSGRAFYRVRLTRPST